MVFEVVVYPLAAVASLLMTYLLLQYLRQQQLFDQPNERSSHSVPVPRGGGISFMTLYLALLGWLLSADSVLVIDSVSVIDIAVLISGGGVLGLVGLLDDRFNLSSKSRFFAQCFCCLIAVSVFYYDQLIVSSWELWLLLIGFALASVWWINLFNFLDGIDGYAVSEALFLCVAGAGFCWLNSAAEYTRLFLLLAATLIGFGVFNWAPAKLFMGDVGSYFLGFIIAMLALLTVREQLVSPLTWIMLTALFWIDASITLVRRVLRRDYWYQAHRSHAYQILSRRWRSHQRVSLLAIGINILWLFPLSFTAQWLIANSRYELVSALFIIACLPIGWGVFRLNAGVDNG